MVLATTAFNISITLAESTAKAPKAPKTEKAAKIKSGKSGNSGKTGNSGKSGSSLVAIVESTTRIIGMTVHFGTATIHSNPNGSFLFQLDMENLDQGCTSTYQCPVSIQEGTDCSNFEGYYTGTDFGSNWKNSGQYYTY